MRTNSIPSHGPVAEAESAVADLAADIRAAGRFAFLFLSWAVCTVGAALILP